MAFSYWENAWWINEEAQFTRIFWDSPSGKSFVFQTFSLWIIWVFVPLSISFLIQWTLVNVRLLTFTDQLTLGERLVFRHLPDGKTSSSPQLTSEILPFADVLPCFPKRWIPLNPGKWYVLRPAFTDRLPLGRLRVIPTFASCFLWFSVTVNSSKFKKTRVFQHSLISSGVENRLYSSVSGRLLLVSWRSLVQKIHVKLGKRKIFLRFLLYLLWKIACVLTSCFFLPFFYGVVTFSI